MTHEEKLVALLEAIAEARNFTLTGQNTKLHTIGNISLAKLQPSEIWILLQKLESDQKVICLVGYPDFLKEYITETNLLNPTDYFELTFTDKFDAWYRNFLLQQRSVLEKLDWKSFLRVYDILQDLDAATRLEKSEQVIIPLIYTPIRFSLLFPHDTEMVREEFMDGRLDALEYLKQAHVVTDFGLVSKGQGMDSRIDATVDITQLDKFLERAVATYKAHTAKSESKKEKKIETQKEPITKIDTTDSIIYTITYNDMTRQILLNHMLLATPRYDGNNERFFQTVYAKPWQELDIAEIYQKADISVDTDVHKILENLGFTKELRQAFFRVNKDKVMFRNPLKKSDLDELNIKAFNLRSSSAKAN